MRLIRFILLFASVFSGTIVASQPSLRQHVIELPKTGDKVMMGGDLSYYIDESAKEDPREVIKRSFKLFDKGVPNFGYTQSAIWICLKINNRSTAEAYYIAIENPHLESVEVFSEEGSLLGSGSKNRKPYINYIFPLDTGFQVRYLRVLTNEPAFLPIRVSEENSINMARLDMDVWQGIFLGILLSVIFYNLVIYFVMKNRVYLFYVLYSCFITLTFGHLTGYMVRSMSPDLYWLNESAILNGLAAVFVVLFVLDFLAEILKKWMRVLGYVFVTLSSLASLGSISGYKLYSNMVMEGSCFVIGILLLAIGFYAVIKLKHKPARFFLTAWTIFIGAAIIYMLKDFGFLPYNAFTQHGIQIGCALEGILMSLALGDKIAQIRKANELALKGEYENQLRYNNLFTQQNAILQNAVDQRTAELQQANSVKDKLFSIVAKDLKAPLNSLEEFLESFQHRLDNSISRTELRSISQKFGVSVNKTIELTDNLLVWAKAKMQPDNLRPEVLSIKPIVRQCVDDLKGASESKQIQINDQTAFINVLADERDLRFIFKNLISSFIKFTPTSGIITITSTNATRQVLISLQTTGDIPEDMMSVLHGAKDQDVLEADGERGANLGLILCKEFIDRNGGSVSVVRHGGTFGIISFPAPALSIS